MSPEFDGIGKLLTPRLYEGHERSKPAWLAIGSAHAWIQYIANLNTALLKVVFHRFDNGGRSGEKS